MNESNREMLVIDATEAVLGRLCSYAAKQSLLGKKVIIVNCGHAIITGGRRMIINEYKHARQRGGASLKGPNFPKHAERLVKRTVRGMLHYTHGRGKDAFKRIFCYDDCPKEFESLRTHLPKRELMAKRITVKELSKEI
jgi:large subunit ribosomal protein L13